MKTMLLGFAMLVGCGTVPDDTDELAPSPAVATGESAVPVEPSNVTPAAIPAGLWIEPGMPVEASQKACRLWGKPFGISCDLVATPGGAAVRVISGKEPDCAPDADNFVWLGSSQIGSGIASIRLVCFRGAVDNDPDIARYYTQVAAHEIGHALGLSHVIAETALMNAIANPFHDVVTPDDRAEWERVHLSR